MSRSIRRWHVVTTTVILVLSALSSLLGLFRPGHYNDPAPLLPRTYAQDAVILVVVVPVLAIGLWYARRGSLRGRIIWLGTLAFMTYIWASYALMTAFNVFYLGYIALFGLSLFTLVGGLVGLDLATIHRSLRGRLSRRWFSGFLGLAALGLAALWLSEIIPALLSGTVPTSIETFGPQAAHTFVLDLGVVVPSLAVTSVWLWRRRPWSYALAGVLLVFTAVLAPTIAAITVVDVQGGMTTSVPVVAGSIIPPLIGAAFAGKYLYDLRAP